jgi:anti-sigma B factor antagonist
MSPVQPPIRITTDDRGAWLLLVVSGDLDLGTADRLRAAAAAAGDDRRLALDLSGIRFIDSSGLRVLLELRTDDTAPVLVDPSSPVRDLLALTMMTDAFGVVDEVAELEAR